MKLYTIKKLINGYKVSPLLKTRTLIAIPHNPQYITTKVNYKDQSMIVNKNTPLLYQKDDNPDKYDRGGFYTLYYCEWMPNKAQMELSI
jgi:hypothetical protein